jgi:MoxR-like ATPase
MQERLWYDGYTEIKVPLWTLIGATNQVPEEPELEAVYDRFLIRQYARPVPENKWAELLEAGWRIESGQVPPAEPILDMDVLSEVHKLVFTVNLEPVKHKLLRLYAVFEERGIHLTDRRKAKALKVVAAHALLEGRGTAEEKDLVALKYIAPRDIDEFEKVNVILSEELRMPERFIKELNDIKANIKETYHLIDTMRSYDPRLVDLFRSLKIAKNRVINIAKESDNPTVKALAEKVLADIDKLLEKISYKLGM